MPNVIEGPALEDYLPHRGLNILIDRTTQYAEGEREAVGGVIALGELTVTDPDPVGRDLFLRRTARDGTALMEQIMAEHLALVCLASLRTEFETIGRAFFSTISAFRQSRPVPAGTSMTATVFETHRRGAFCSYRGRIAAGRDEVASLDIMAFYAHPELGTEHAGLGGGDKKVGQAPRLEEDRPVDPGRFGWKRPEMIFIQRRVQFNPDERSATYAYVYPHDHPHVPGHFPEQAVMMGIAQWVAAADALYDMACDLCAGAPQVKGSAQVVREDGTIICEVRALELAMDGAAGGGPPVPDLVATRKVGFRDMVRPGEEIFVRVRMDAG